MGEEKVYVSSRTAKMLRQVGFEKKCKNEYTWWPSAYFNEHYVYQAPYLDQAHNWIKAHTRLQVNVLTSSESTWTFRIKRVNQCGYGERGVLECREDYRTPEEALEAGIQDCLYRLIEGMIAFY